MKDLNFNSLYKLTVFLIFATLSIYILIVGQGVIVPLIVAFLLAFLLIPPTTLLERIGLNRILAAILSVFFTIVLLSGFLTFLGSQLGRLVRDFDGAGAKFNDLRNRLPDSISREIEGYSFDEAIAYAQSHFGEIVGGLTSFLGSFSFVFIVPVYIVLILVYRDFLKEFLYKVFKVEDREKAHASTAMEHIKNGHESDGIVGIVLLIPKIRLITQHYITGMFYVMCILFVLYSALLLGLGIEHAILFAALAASLNIIPYVGPILGSALPVLYALLTKDSFLSPVLVLSGFILIQAIESNFLTPKIVGNNVSLNPLVTIITLIFGGAVWGVVGMILFIPIVAILKEIMGVINGLEPYAFLLGNPEPERSSGPGFMVRWYSRLRDKIKH